MTEQLAPANDELDPLRLAQEIFRALRGRRSQVQFSARIGYQSNVAHAWESGRSLPTATAFFGAARKCGVDLDSSLKRFFGRLPASLERANPATPRGLVRLLATLRGEQEIKQIVNKVGRNRFAVSRWFNGKAEPRLDEFFCLVSACTLRLADFIAAFVDPTQLPSLSPHWQRIQAARKAAYEHPLSHAVLRVLELEAYKKLPQHAPGWIASRLGMSQNEEQKYLSLLRECQQIHWNEDRWVVSHAESIDLRGDSAAFRRTAVFWAGRGLERLESAASGSFSYNVFGASNQDMARLQELQRAYFAKARQIIADSSPVEQVGVMNLQLFAIVTSSD